MAGNHDWTILMRLIFRDRFTGWTRRELFRETPLLFLGRGRKRLLFPEVRFLKKSFRSAGRHIVFTHYPFFPAGVKYMDTKYPFLDSPRVRRLLEARKGDVVFFAGHYHYAGTVSNPYCQLYLTPSTFFQIDPAAPRFTVESTEPAWRRIEIGQKIVTEVPV
jgi:Icc protein